MESLPPNFVFTRYFERKIIGNIIPHHLRHLLSISSLIYVIEKHILAGKAYGKTRWALSEEASTTFFLDDAIDIRYSLFFSNYASHEPTSLLC